MTTPSIAEARAIVASLLHRYDREQLTAFIDQAEKIALVANQLAGALERADSLNSLVTNVASHRDQSLAALKAYSDL